MLFEGCGSSFKGVIFKPYKHTSSFGICCEIALRWMPQHLTHEVNIDEGNDWVPSGNNLLPEQLLTHIYVALWRH